MLKNKTFAILTPTDTTELAVQVRRTLVTQGPFARTCLVQAWTMCPSCQLQQLTGPLVLGLAEIPMPLAMRPTPRAWPAQNDNTAT